MNGKKIWQATLSLHLILVVAWALTLTPRGTIRLMFDAHPTNGAQLADAAHVPAPIQLTLDAHSAHAGPLADAAHVPTPIQLILDAHPSHAGQLADAAHLPAPTQLAGNAHEEFAKSGSVEIPTTGIFERVV